MNIFYLDENPEVCATYYGNIHVSKMTLETAQILSNAFRFYFGDKDNKYQIMGELNELVYKPYSLNHPCNIWARKNKENYEWLYRLFVALGEEYIFRFDKTHLSYTKLKDVLRMPPMIDNGEKFFPPPLVMEEQFKNESDVIGSYRNYYSFGKASLLNYTKRKKPDWLGK